jgi:hypothetical protein
MASPPNLLSQREEAVLQNNSKHYLFHFIYRYLSTMENIRDSNSKAKMWKA